MLVCLDTRFFRVLQLLSSPCYVCVLCLPFSETQTTHRRHFTGTSLGRVQHCFFLPKHLHARFGISVPVCTIHLSASTVSIWALISCTDCVTLLRHSSQSSPHLSPNSGGVCACVQPQREVRLLLVAANKNLVTYRLLDESGDKCQMMEVDDMGARSLLHSSGKKKLVTQRRTY